jgi:hypothetical protein
MIDESLSAATGFFFLQSPKEQAGSFKLTRNAWHVSQVLYKTQCPLNTDIDFHILAFYVIRSIF